jgi:hypothetical protein
VEDLDDVKTHAHAGAPLFFVPCVLVLLLFEQGVPFAGRLYDPALFFPVHRFGGSPIGFVGAGFDLHKNQHARAPDAAHQIHFAAIRGAEVLVKDFVSGFAQKVRRPAFAFPAESGGVGLRSRLLEV